MAKKWEERLADLSVNLADLSQKAKEASDDAKAYRELREELIKDKISTAKGNVAALQEKARIAEEENRGKISSALLKAQMTVKAKREDLKDAHDKKKLERYIDDQILYIAECYDAASFLICEAELAILETIEAAEEYEQRFGTKEEEN